MHYVASVFCRGPSMNGVGGITSFRWIAISGGPGRSKLSDICRRVRLCSMRRAALKTSFV